MPFAKFQLICKMRYDSVQNNRQFGENMMVHPNIADYKVSEMATTIVKLHIWFEAEIAKNENGKKFYSGGMGVGVSKEVWQMSWIYFFLNTSLPVASAKKYTCYLDKFWFWWKTYSCGKDFSRFGNLYNLWTIFVDNFFSENCEIWDEEGGWSKMKCVVA